MQKITFLRDPLGLQHVLVMSPLVHSGILLAAVVSVLLNLYVNGMKHGDAARHDAARIAAHSEAG